MSSSRQSRKLRMIQWVQVVSSIHTDTVSESDNLTTVLCYKPCSLFSTIYLQVYFIMSVLSCHGWRLPIFLKDCWSIWCIAMVRSNPLYTWCWCSVSCVPADQIRDHDPRYILSHRLHHLKVYADGQRISMCMLQRLSYSLQKWPISTGATAAGATRVAFLYLREQAVNSCQHRHAWNLVAAAWKRPCRYFS